MIAIALARHLSKPPVHIPSPHRPGPAYRGAAPCCRTSFGAIALDAISGFSIRRWTWYNRQPMGHVDLKDGRSMHISAIQVNNIGGGAAQRVVDELNAILPTLQQRAATCPLVGT